MSALAKLALGNPWVLGGMAGAMMLATGAAYVKGRLDGGRLARADMIENAERTINEIASVAERARAMRRHCNSIGLQFDPERIGCVGR